MDHPLPYPCHSLENPLFHAPLTPLAHRGSSVNFDPSPRSPAHCGLEVPSPPILGRFMAAFLGSGTPSAADSLANRDDAPTDGADGELFAPDTAAVPTDGQLHADAFPLSYTPRRRPSHLTALAASSSTDMSLDMPLLSPTALIPRHVRDPGPDHLSLGSASASSFASIDEQGARHPYVFGRYADISVMRQTQYRHQPQEDELSDEEDEEEEDDEEEEHDFSERYPMLDIAGLHRVSPSQSSSAFSAPVDAGGSVPANLSLVPLMPWNRPQSLLSPPKAMSDLDHESEYSAPSFAPISPAPSVYQETSPSIRGFDDDNFTLSELPQSPQPPRKKRVKKRHTKKNGVTAHDSAVAVAATETAEPIINVADDDEASEHSARLNNKRTFKVALWEAINNAAYKDVIRWSHGGTSGVIPDKKKFEGSQAMKSITDAKDAGGFVRQLHMWGFQRYREGGERSCGFSHPLFQRGRPDLLERLVRKGESKPARIYSKPRPKKKRDARGATQSQPADSEAFDEQSPTESSESALYWGAVPLRKSTRRVSMKPNYAEDADGLDEATEEPDYWADTGSSSRTDDGSWGTPATTASLLAVDEPTAPNTPTTPSSVLSSLGSELSHLTPLPGVGRPKTRKPRAPKATGTKRPRGGQNGHIKAPGSPLKRACSVSPEQGDDTNPTPNNSSDSSDKAINSRPTKTAKNSNKRART